MCVLSKLTTGAIDNYITQHVLVTKQNETIYCDLYRPMEDGMYIIILIDCFDKYLVADVVDGTSISIIKCIIFKWCLFFGWFDSIVTDNASYFISHIIKLFYYCTGITHKRIVTYSPWVNRAELEMKKLTSTFINSNVAIAILGIKRSIKYINKKYTNYKDYLNGITYCHNATYNINKYNKYTDEIKEYDIPTNNNNNTDNNKDINNNEINNNNENNIDGENKNNIDEEYDYYNNKIKIDDNIKYKKIITPNDARFGYTQVPNILETNLKLKNINIPVSRYINKNNQIDFNKFIQYANMQRNNILKCIRNNNILNAIKTQEKYNMQYHKHKVYSIGDYVIYVQTFKKSGKLVPIGNYGYKIDKIITPNRFIIKNIFNNQIIETNRKHIVPFYRPIFGSHSQYMKNMNTNLLKLQNKYQ